MHAQVWHRGAISDDFILDLFAEFPLRVIKAAHLHRRALQNPARSAKEHLVAYGEAGLSKVAARLEQHISDL